MQEDQEALGPIGVHRAQPHTVPAFDLTFGWWSFFVTAWKTDYFGKLLVFLLVLVLVLLVGVPIWLLH